MVDKRFYTLDAFTRAPLCSALCGEVDALTKKAALAKALKLAQEWNEEVFGFEDNSGRPVRIKHPAGGFDVDITYLDFSKPGVIVAEGWCDRPVIRSPRTNPSIAIRRERSRIKLSQCRAHEIQRLTEQLEAAVSISGE